MFYVKTATVLLLIVDKLNEESVESSDINPDGCEEPSSAEKNEEKDEYSDNDDGKK